MPIGYNWYVNKYSESESERTRRYAGRSNKIHRRPFICESSRHHITLVEDAVELYWVTVHEKTPVLLTFELGKTVPYVIYSNIIAYATSLWLLCT